MQPKALTQTVNGMQNVEREIIDQVRERKIDIHARNFSWNHGRELTGIPSVVHMQVRVGTREIEIDWPREWLADSWDRIDRWEVRRQIEHIIDDLVPQP